MFNAKFVAMKYEIFGLKLEIKSLKECIEKINSKLLPDRNYNQELNTKNSFFRTTKFSFKARNCIKTEYY